MIGYFTVKEFVGGNDSAGFKRQTRAVSDMEPGFECFLFLPPYLRAVSCEIEAGSHVFGIVDDVSGLGVALYGVDGADFGYKFDTEIHTKDTLAGKVSLKDHTHAINAAQFTGNINPQTGAASGTISGDTEKPTVAGV